MDPVTQGIVGSLWALPAARRERLRQAALAGWAGGMAPDLDVLIRSSQDSLLAIEYHRHFTHALAFIPIGSLAVALVLWPLMRKHAGFGLLYLWCLLGYASHGLLDTATSYGTYLLWPFSDQRVAWNFISVIDPLYSLPLLVLLGIAVWRRRRLPVALAWFWLIAYMGFGAFQNARAEQIVDAWAQEQGIAVNRSVAKPAFANLVLWRGLIDDGERFHLVAVRTLPGTSASIWPGGSVLRFSAGTFDPGTRLGNDLARFEHFSSRWLFRYPDYDQGDRWFVGDLRYAIDPGSQRPLWGVVFDPDYPGSAARYTTPR
ncbi:MAG: metal-dependent hydrolase, partial [Wenzhouxiangella sp.]|nr:metal-dependent hydrolase [Wenzhouxiangella sp.]